MDNAVPDEIERLIRELKDDRRDVRSRAAYELGKHRDPRTLEPLIAALSDNDKFVRSWAAGALGKAGPAAIEPLLTALDASDPTAGYYAALALGELGDLRAVPMLAQALHEGDWDIRPSAASALAGLGDPSTLPERILTEKGLSGADRARMLAALREVAYTDDQVQIHYSIPDATEFCRERSQSPDDAIRKGAIEALQAPETAPPPEPMPAVAVAPKSAVQSPESPPAPETARAKVSPPAAVNPLPAAPEPEKPKRSFWKRLTGR